MSAFFAMCGPFCCLLTWLWHILKKSTPTVGMLFCYRLVVVVSYDYSFSGRSCLTVSAARHISLSCIALSSALRFSR